MTPFAEIKASFPSLFSESARIDCGEGWAGIAEKLLDGIATTPGLPEKCQYRILSVRQDRGALRIEARHVGICGNTFRPMIMLAEFRSRVTCEVCGQPGHMRSASGWKRCRCGEHSTQEEREQSARPDWTLGR